MSLIPGPQAKDRFFQKQYLILKFLSSELATTRENVQLLLGHKTRQSAYSTLAKIEKNGLVRREKIRFAHRTELTFWGITRLGQESLAKIEGRCVDSRLRTFQGSKLKESSISHKLDLQMLRILMEKLGWQSWETGFGMECKKIRPDALATSPSGEVVAFELERNVKSTKDRYRKSLIEHLLARKEGLWKHIFYVTPCEWKRDQLRSKFFSLNEVSFNGRRIHLSEEHFDPFKFLCFSDLMKLI